MIEDSELLLSVKTLLLRYLADYDPLHLTGVVVTGSAAYPEFRRKESDIDVIAVVSAPWLAEPGSWSAHCIGRVPGLEDVIEAKVFTDSSLFAYLSDGELTRSFEFKRGHRIIVDPNGTLSRAAKAAALRIKLEIESLRKHLSDVDVGAKFKFIQFQAADTQSYLTCKRIVDNRALFWARLSEWLIDFLFHLNVAYFAALSQSTVTIGDKDLEWLLMLSTYRGGRMLDHEKYAVPPRVKLFLRDVDANCHSVDNSDVLIAKLWPLCDSLLREYGGPESGLSIRSEEGAAVVFDGHR